MLRSIGSIGFGIMLQDVNFKASTGSSSKKRFPHKIARTSHREIQVRPENLSNYKLGSEAVLSKGARLKSAFGIQNFEANF